MKIFILAIVLIYIVNDVFADFLKQDYKYKFGGHTREKRQQHNFGTVNQAPAPIQQLLHAQNSRPPLIPVPAQPIPKLGPSQPIQPQQLSQTQVSQYRPQVQIASGVQQPDYRAITGKSGQYNRPILPQQPQYRPAPQSYPQQNYNSGQQPHYSSKLPPHIQQLLQYQSSLGNSIPRGG